MPGRVVASDPARRPSPIDLPNAFLGNGFSDLAVGAPTASLYSASGGGVLAPGPVLTQGGGLTGTPEVADLAGAALA